MFRVLVLGILLLAVPASSFAQPAPDGASDAAAEAKRLKTAEQAAREDAASKRFAGVRFGVALAVIAAFKFNTRIEDAVLAPDDDSVPPEQRLVRATKRKSVDTRLMLESHYFFTHKPWPKFGWGPFVMLQPGSGEIVDGAGLGIMVGWRRAKDQSDSFNIGVGVFVERNVKDLGEGISEDKPLPAGETEIRFQEKAVGSWAVLVSFSF